VEDEAAQSQLEAAGRQAEQEGGRRSWRRSMNSRVVPVVRSISQIVPRLSLAKTRSEPSFA
jgi:hypothetical protein